jgi:prepilin peptidase CpaA
MAHPFFPTVEFGWAFFGTLVGLLVVCAWVDLNKMVIPKWLTLPALGLGLAFNVIRGSLQGLDSSVVWQLEPGGLFIGAVDALLFSVAGFAVAFGLFFALWMIGVCGGGDVKLCAAVGAWIGPGLVFRLLLMTIFMVAVFMVAQLAYAVLFGSHERLMANKGKAKGSGDAGVVDKPLKRWLAFSPPLALATTLLLLWTFRGELHLLPVGPPANVSTALGALRLGGCLKKGQAPLHEQPAGCFAQQCLTAFQTAT